MTKDDYDVIACRILVYLYACFKCRITFDETKFRKTALKNVKSEEYLDKIIRMMQAEQLISGARFTKVWGNEYIMLSELNELEITAGGIHYLQENERMKSVLQMLSDAADIMAGMIGMLQLLP